VTAGELDNAKLAVAAAQAKLSIAQADEAAWRDDIKVAQAQIIQAQARVDATKVALSLLEIRAPISGQVLQVKVRAGEFAPTGALATPLITLGAVEKLHVRVAIDENEAWRITQGARAKANARGNADLAVSLTFERIEPLVVPKRGDTLVLNGATIALYDRIISRYEGHDLKNQGDRLVIDGTVTDRYVVEQDYYFMLGDSRHFSSDSRFWGFVPQDHLVGRASLVILSGDHGPLLSAGSRAFTAL
jgi:hypothetical protein